MTHGLSQRWAALKAKQGNATVPAAQVCTLVEMLQPLPEAVQNLRQTGQLVEQATAKIMDECDRVRVCGRDIQALLDGLEVPLDVDVQAALESALEEMNAGILRVYELCNFQDLNQQNQVRTMQLLSGIENQLAPVRAMVGVVKPVAEQVPSLQQDEVDSLLGTLER